MRKVSKKLVSALKQANKTKTSAYDTTATVKRIEGNTAWVHIPGGVAETPVKLTINASVGDTVQVRVSGGKAWITGNATVPPTGDAEAIVAQLKAADAADAAGKAQSSADDAAKVATNYIDYDATTGLTVGYNALASKVNVKGDGVRIYDENGRVGTYVSSSGMEVYVGTTSYANFGITVRLGNSNSYHVTLNGNSLDFAIGGTDVGGIAMYYDSDAQESTLNIGGAYADNSVLTNSAGVAVVVTPTNIDCQGEILAEDGIRNVNNKWLARYDLVDSMNAFGNTNEKTVVRGTKIYRSGSGTSFDSSSDIRLKENIKPLDYASDIVLNLDPFEFTWKDGWTYDHTKHFGVSAQKVRELFEANGLNADEYSLCGEDNGYFTLQYGDFIPMLIETIQVQEKKINELSNSIKTLEAYINNSFNGNPVKGEED